MDRPTDIALALMHRHPYLGPLSPLQLLATAGYDTTLLVGFLDQLKVEGGHFGPIAAKVRESLGNLDRELTEEDFAEDRERIGRLFADNSQG